MHLYRVMLHRTVGTATRPIDVYYIAPCGRRLVSKCYSLGTLLTAVELWWLNSTLLCNWSNRLLTYRDQWKRYMSSVSAYFRWLVVSMYITSLNWNFLSDSNQSRHSPDLSIYVWSTLLSVYILLSPKGTSIFSVLKSFVMIYFLSLDRTTVYSWHFIGKGKETNICKKPACWQPLSLNASLLKSSV